MKAASAVRRPCPSNIRTMYVPEQFVCMNECTQREPTTKVKRTEAGEERGLWISCEKCQRRGEKKKKGKKKPHHHRDDDQSKNPQKNTSLPKQQSPQ